MVEKEGVVDAFRPQRLQHVGFHPASRHAKAAGLEPDDRLVVGRAPVVTDGDDFDQEGIGVGLVALGDFFFIARVSEHLRTVPDLLHPRKPRIVRGASASTVHRISAENRKLEFDLLVRDSTFAESVES